MMKPQGREIVASGKRGLCGFATTNLDFILRQNECKNIVLGGFLTNCCIESSMRSAYELGYKGELNDEKRNVMLFVLLLRRVFGVCTILAFMWVNMYVFLKSFLFGPLSSKMKSTKSLHCEGLLCCNKCRSS